MRAHHGSSLGLVTIQRWAMGPCGDHAASTCPVHRSHAVHLRHCLCAVSVQPLTLSPPGAGERRSVRLLVRAREARRELRLLLPTSAPYSSSLLAAEEEAGPGLRRGGPGLVAEGWRWGREALAACCPAAWLLARLEGDCFIPLLPCADDTCRCGWGRGCCCCCCGCCCGLGRCCRPGFVLAAGAGCGYTAPWLLLGWRLVLLPLGRLGPPYSSSLEGGS
jgi:hypothetical protein